MFPRTLSALAAAALLAVAGTSAASAQDLDTSTMLVPFADLDISTHAGMSRLDTRLKSAAAKVCNSGYRDLQAQRLDNDCRKRALNGARTEVASLVRTGSGRTEVALRR